MGFLNKVFHRHKLKVVSADEGYDYFGNYGYEDGKGHPWGRPVTRLVLKCSECGQLKEKTVEGRHADRLLKNESGGKGNQA